MKRIAIILAAALIAALAAPPARAQSCSPNYTDYGSTPALKIPKAGCAGYDTHVSGNDQTISDFIGVFANPDGTLKEDVDASEWMQVTGPVTYISASSFSVPATAVFTVGRKIFANQSVDVVGVVRSANTAGGTTTVVLGAIVLASDNLTSSTITDPITSVSVSMVTPQSAPVAATNSSGYAATLVNTGATADRAYTLPNVSGTVMIAGNAVIANVSDFPTVGSNGGKILKVNSGGTAFEVKTIPAFRAYAGTSQPVTNGVNTKVILPYQTFDTNNDYDQTTNYRFTATVAGYYLFVGSVEMNSPAAGHRLWSRIYKNGSPASDSISHSAGASATLSSLAVDIIYMNGTTDYVELYAYHTDTSARSIVATTGTYFAGTLIRAD